MPTRLQIDDFRQSGVAKYVMAAFWWPRNKTDSCRQSAKVIKVYIGI